MFAAGKLANALDDLMNDDDREIVRENLTNDIEKLTHEPDELANDVDELTIDPPICSLPARW